MDYVIEQKLKKILTEIFSDEPSYVEKVVEVVTDYEESMIYDKEMKERKEDEQLLLELSEGYYTKEEAKRLLHDSSLIE